MKEESLHPNPSPTPVDIPLVYNKTQCIFCIGNEKYSYEKRTRSFRRVSHMMDHVEKVHLKYISLDEKVICHHPVYKSQGLVLNGVNHFKNHVQVVHETILREPRFVD